MTFHVRHWLARELGVQEAHLHLLSDRPDVAGMREIRYLLSGRGVISVSVVKAYHEATWVLEATWSAGEVLIEVGIDQEVVG